jgi:hypothetical protein
MKMLRMMSLLACLLLLTISLGMASALAVNKALSLDGDGDYVEIVDSPVLNNLDTKITIEVWIKADGYPGEWTPIICKSDEYEPSYSNRSFTLWLNYNGYIHFTSAPTGSGQIELNSPPESIHLYTWYHIAGVIDAVNHSIKLFINGNEVFSGSYGDSIRTSTLPLRIGSEQAHTIHQTFLGFIDEARIWNIARTQEEIQDAMNRPLTSKEINSGNVVGYWNFDDGTASDLSPYGNHGTLMGDAEIVEPGAPIVYTGSINGTVTDMEGNPIKWALVIAVLGETKEKAVTNRDGYYKIPDLEQGIYWVLCIKEGYKLGVRKPEVITGRETTVNFRLRQKPD